MKANENATLKVADGSIAHVRQNSAPSFSSLQDDEQIGTAISSDSFDRFSHTSDTFRPASEVFYSNEDDNDRIDYFDRRASMPSAKFFRSNLSECSVADEKSEPSKIKGKQDQPSQLQENLHLSLVPAISDPELTVRRDRARNIKGFPSDLRKSKSVVENHKSLSNDKKEDIISQKKLQKNLESWKAKENSNDSASNARIEDVESKKSKKWKRDDSKRRSSPIFPKRFPRSPQNKQKKLSMEEAEIAIAHSPVYLDDVNKRKPTKGRPLPINVANESEILKGLDSGSYENVQTPDIIINEAEKNVMEDSFESAIERFNRQKVLNSSDFEFSNSTPVQYDEKHKRTSCDLDDGDDGKNKKQNGTSSFKDEVDGEAPESPSFLECDYSITVTGSVNDETLIMEDKITGLDLSGLMDMTNMKRNRKISKQRGEKEGKIKETAITFV